MGTTTELIIKINGDVKNFQAKLDEVKKQSADLENVLASVAKVSALAFAALTGTIGASIVAFRQQEKATNELATAMKNQGIYSDALIKKYQEQAAAIQKVTTYGDEEVLTAQAKLQAYVGNTEVTVELTKATLDFAAAQGIDLANAAQLVGKAIGTSTNALSRYGIEIDSNARGQERMQAVVKGLSTLFDGQAAAAAKGSGAFIQLKNAIGDLFEAIGEQLVPILAPAIKQLTSFIDIIGRNKELASFAANTLLIGAAVTGVVTVVVTGALAFSKLRTAIEAGSIAMRLFGISAKTALISSGIGIALVALTEAYLYFSNKAAEGTEKSTEALRSHKEEIKKIQEEIKKVEETPISLAAGLRMEQYERAKQARLSKLRETLEEEISLEKEYQESKKKALALGEIQTSKNDKLALERESQQAHIDAITAQTLAGGEKLAKIREEQAQVLKSLAETTNQDEYNAYVEKYNKLLELEQTEQEALLEQRTIFNEEILAQSEEFKALDDEQKASFLEKNQAAIQSELLTEKQARMLAAEDEIKRRVAANNKYLAEQQRYGKAYAEINKFFDDAVTAERRQALGDLADMQRSNNATLKAIGKAAAIANIVIKTRESAMNVYAGFSTIPFIGHALGIAAAAATVAWGAEQIAGVVSAADGGLITGGVSGKDSVPAMLMPGEMVVPKQNFEEVVSATAAAREIRDNNANDVSGAPGFGGRAEIVLSLKDELVEFIEAKLVERQNLNISLQGAS